MLPVCQSALLSTPPPFPQPDMVGSLYLAAVTALIAATFASASEASVWNSYDPKYQVPFADGSGGWAESFKKAKAIV